MLARALLLPALSLTLLACSAEEAPQREAAPASSAGTAVPSAAASATVEGAEAFATLYYEEVGRAFAALDPTRLRTLSTPSCMACAALADSIAAEAQSGRRYQGGEVTVRTAEAAPLQGERTTVTLAYDIAPLVQLEAPAGAPTRPARAGVRVGVKLVHGDGQWRVEELARAEG